MAIKRNTLYVLKEAIEQIDLGEDEINILISGISSIHLFDDVLDFRQLGKTKYPLKDILMMTFLVLLERGKQSFEYIADYIALNKKRFVRYGLLNEDLDTPSHDTFRRIFSLLDADSLRKHTIDRFYEFLKDIEIKEKGLAHLAIDGKQVNSSGRSQDSRNPQNNYNVLNVYSSTYGTCLYSEVVNDKTNEIPAGQEALSNFNLKKTVVTADALHLQSKTIDIINSKGGKYLITLKENQKGLYEEVLAKFNNPRLKKSIKLIEKDTYTLEILKLPKNYMGYENFKNIKTFIRMTSNKNPKKTVIRYFVSDLLKTDEIEFSVNERWSIENDLHKLKDTYLHEDEFRCTDKNAVKNIVVMNNLICQLINIYYPLSGYEYRLAKIALSTNTYEEILKLLTFLSSDTIKEKLIKAVSKKK